jgi:predicted nucleotidyltransferase
MIRVSEQERLIVKAVLEKHVPGCPVIAFGSRVREKHKRYSDLDLAIIGDGKLAPTVLYAIMDDFEDSDLPYRVDVLDWHRTNPGFQEIIRKRYEVVQ